VGVGAAEHAVVVDGVDGRALPGGRARVRVVDCGEHPAPVDEPGISPDRRSCTPASLHNTVRAKMTVAEVVDWPSGSGGRADPAAEPRPVTGLPGARSCWAHSFGGSGGPGASFGRRRNSFAGPMPAKGRDRSFRAWQKDATEGFVLGASQEGERIAMSWSSRRGVSAVTGVRALGRALRRAVPSPDPAPDPDAVSPALLAWAQALDASRLSERTVKTAEQYLRDHRRLNYETRR